MWRYLIAYYWGFRDGWEQPWELTSSANIEHLTTEDHDLMAVQNWLDRGINMGQTLRGGHRSQADQEGFVPFALRWRLLNAAALLGLGSIAGVRMGSESIDGLTASLTVASLWCLLCMFTGWPHHAPRKEL